MCSTVHPPAWSLEFYRVVCELGVLDRGFILLSPEQTFAVLFPDAAMHRTMGVAQL